MCGIVLQALKYFQEAEETVPGFFPGNWLYLAKTHYQLSNKPEAKKWVTKVLDHKVVNKEDEGVSVYYSVHIEVAVTL